jgi:hypothetical protein
VSRYEIWYGRLIPNVTSTVAVVWLCFTCTRYSGTCLNVDSPLAQHGCGHGWLHKHRTLHQPCYTHKPPSSTL